jgi:hypothetical protein
VTTKFIVLVNNPTGIEVLGIKVAHPEDDAPREAFEAARAHVRERGGEPVVVETAKDWAELTLDVQKLLFDLARFEKTSVAEWAANFPVRVQDGVVVNPRGEVVYEQVDDPFELQAVAEVINKTRRDHWDEISEEVRRRTEELRAAASGPPTSPAS